MCGRFTITMSAQEIHDLLKESFHIDSADIPSQNRYNIAPTQDVLSVLYDGRRYRAGTLSWGFHFKRNAKDILAFNTRYETIQSKPFFQDLYKNQRIIFISNGYFEWEKTTQTPWYIHDDSVLFLGGLWRKETRYAGSIITLEAPDELAKIHPRVPLTMTLEQAKAWLKHEENDPLNVYQRPRKMVALSSRVNAVKHNDKEIFDSLD